MKATKKVNRRNLLAAAATALLGLGVVSTAGLDSASAAAPPAQHSASSAASVPHGITVAKGVVSTNASIRW